MKEKIFVTKSSIPSIDEYMDEIRDIWESHHLTNMGIKHMEFERKLKKLLCVDNLELMVNGHMALEMTIQAFGFKPNSEVITTPYTFASTTHAIVRNNLKPVFCDIDEENFCIDSKKIESLITPNTVAILPVHVYGNICDIDVIDKIAKKYNLKVIYDAAHAFNEEYCGQNIATFGDASIFSFHATKVFNSIEGGVSCFKDLTLKDKIYSLKNFGIKDEETVRDIGANAKMNEFCAAMGLCNLRHLENEIEKRKNIFELYVDGLRDVKGLRINIPYSTVKSNYSYFPILFDEEKYGVDRDWMKKRLEEEGICARKYFYPITSKFDCYKNKFDINNTPIAQKVSESVLTIPLYSDLKEEVVYRIIKILRNPR